MVSPTRYSDLGEDNLDISKSVVFLELYSKHSRQSVFKSHNSNGWGLSVRDRFDLLRFFTGGVESRRLMRSSNDLLRLYFRQTESIETMKTIHKDVTRSAPMTKNIG